MSDPYSLSGIPVYRSWLVDEGMALIVRDPRAMFLATGITDGSAPTPRRRYLDMSYVDDTPMRRYWEYARDHDEEWLVWQASGWLWYFDTEWRRSRNGRDDERVMRYQDIFGCANVAWGPHSQGRRDAPGVWCRLTPFQTVRHRPELCYCKTGEAERRYG